MGKWKIDEASLLQLPGVGSELGNLERMAEEIFLRRRAILTEKLKIGHQFPNQLESSVDYEEDTADLSHFFSPISTRPEFHTATCEFDQPEQLQRWLGTRTDTLSARKKELKRLNRELKGLVRFDSWFDNPSAVDFAAEISRSPRFIELRAKHGGFWIWICRDRGEVDARTNPRDSQLINGAFEFEYLVPGIHRRMEQQRVSLGQVLDVLRDATVACPCVGEQVCITCHESFLPNAWTYVDLRLGADICTICAAVATNGHNDYFWAEMSAIEIEKELAVGLALMLKSRNVIFNEIPHLDSVMAITQATLIKSDSVKARHRFLEISVRPKESQVCKVFENWDQWLWSIGGTPLDEKPIIAKDGHLCRSRGEKVICDYLASKNISHAREPFYRDFVRENDISLVQFFKGDFAIDGVIYEYAGLSGDSAYDMRLASKINEASICGMRVVVIYPEDLANLGAIIKVQGEEADKHSKSDDLNIESSPSGS